jgi:transposase
VPRRYPVAFRRKVLDLIDAGTPVAEIAAQLGVSDQTIYNWRRQDQVDRGLRAGITTRESAELTAARKRIRELETELAVTKRANELLKARSDPKGVDVHVIHRGDVHVFLQLGSLVLFYSVVSAPFSRGGRPGRLLGL